MSTRYRPDIDGFRAVAIVLVVLYHCSVPGLRNGFVGVDIFFVISGFVITAGLVGEIDRTDKVDVLRFWTRRVLRLMPAATVTVLAVLVVGRWVFTALEYPKLVSDAWAATLYRANFHFAGDGTGYFDQATPSPLLHMWSLAVEEQFYLLWPLLLLVVQRLWPRSRFALRMAVASVTVVSFVVLLRSSDLHYSFYSPLTRAWEFGVGALVALIPASRQPVGRAASAAMGTCGVIATGAALALVEPARFPSGFTVLPVAGAAALIVASAHPQRLFAKALNRRPFVFVGKLSYSWYLWHWPVLVVATHRSSATSWWYRLGLGALSLIPAWLTHALIENPIRHNFRLRAAAGRSAVAVAMCAAVAAASVTAASAYSRTQLDDPLLNALHRAQSDHESFTPDCASADALIIIEGCTHGDRNGRGTILVLGDSHALQWLPALDPAARELGMRLNLSVLGACPVIDVKAADETPGCEARRAEIPELIDTLKPDLVVLAHSLGYLDSIVGPDGRTTVAGQSQAWERALFDFATAMKDRRTGLLVLLDTPRYDRDPIGCVVETRDPRSCSLTRSNADEIVGRSHELETNALARAQFGQWMDPLPLICNTQLCPLITDDGVVTFHDTHHLTASFASTLSSAMEEQLGMALRRAS